MDDDSKPGVLVFNKTVGLRDSWAKQTRDDSSRSEAKSQNNQNQNKPKPQQQRSALSVIQQLGKKYTNLSEEKQLKAKAEIQELSKNVSYDELEPLFGTAAKKAGTRIAVMIVLKELLKKGLERNDAINTFIEKAKDDKSELLITEAKGL